MVDLLFDGKAVAHEERLLDPGCGAGAFMKGVLRWSARTHSPLPHVTGIELDKQLARETASQLCSNPQVNVIQEDFLRTRPGEKYHYVIGNPPYVSILQLDEREKAEYKTLYRSATGRFDLYMLFFERALQILEPGGRLVFVTPEKFTYVDSASSLRALMRAYDVRKLELLPENVFGDLTTYPLVTVVENSKDRRPTSILNREGDEKTAALPRGGASWGPLLNGPKSDLKPRRMTNVLSRICDRVSCGIATGADEIFVFERNELPDDLHKFAWPTVAGRDLDPSKGRIETRSVMLIPYNAHGTLIPLEDLGPLRQYLMDPQVVARLLKRTCASRKPWYAFHENPAMSQILRPKILCKDIARQPAFWLDRSGETVPRHSVYYVVPKDESLLDPLCEYLNGKQARDWLIENCQRAANGFIRTQSNVLKRLPIPYELVTDTRNLIGPMLNPQRLHPMPTVLEMVA